MFEKLLGAFGYGKMVPEDAVDLIAASERRTSGWVRTLDREGRFLGFRFYCPGKTINTSRPARFDERDATGRLLKDEVPILQNVGCSFVTGEILPMQTLADVRARCGQCGTESVLLTWMRENKIAQFDAIPSEARVPLRAQRRMTDTWNENLPSGVTYEMSDPSVRGF